MGDLLGFSRFELIRVVTFLASPGDKTVQAPTSFSLYSYHKELNVKHHWDTIVKAAFFTKLSEFGRLGLALSSSFGYKAQHL